MYVYNFTYIEHNFGAKKEVKCQATVKMQSLQMIFVISL